MPRGFAGTSSTPTPRRDIRGWIGGTGYDLHARTRPGLCGLRTGVDRHSERDAMSQRKERLCTFDGCNKKHKGRGLCIAHYNQQWNGKPLTPLVGRTATQGMSDEERFWSHVDKSGDCWIWTGPTNGTGYGRVWFAGKNQYPHRVSYELLVSPIPAGMFIDHICHKPLCVNPRHLRLANNKQNQENISGPRIDNGSGVRGVTWTGRNWQVRVGHNGRSHYAGVFYDIKEAEKTAIALRNRLFTHNNLDRIAS